MPDDERRAAPNSPRKLRAAREVQRILKVGSAARSKRVVVYLARGSGPPRAAWVAGRRVGGAVARNRARRLLREAWVAISPRVEEGWVAVFVARVERSYWGGDHSLFLGRVEYARYSEGTPLLFHGGRYERLTPSAPTR